MNNQKQISLALHHYEGERGAFPGYVGEIYAPVNGVMHQRKITWWVSILPHLERMELYNLWKDLNIGTTYDNVGAAPPSTPPGDNTVPNNLIPGVYMRIAICPSYSPPSDKDSWLSYRVNVGRMMGNTLQGAAQSSATFIPAEGVFTDQCQDNRVASPAATQEQIVRVGLSSISSNDGTSTTLMLAENAASVPPPNTYAFDGRWAPVIEPPPTIDGVSIATVNTSTYYQAAHDATILGFNWAGMDPSDPNGTKTKTLQTPATKIYSNHPGGVVVSFCDSHQSFLKTDIEPFIYMQLMCPFDRGVYISGGGATPLVTGIADPLNAGAFVPPIDESRY